MNSEKKLIDQIESKLNLSSKLEAALPPVDQRIQAYLDRLFADLPKKEGVCLPGNTLTLDCAGMASILSLPRTANRFDSDIISSYRVKQGVLHNPKNDRRTTQGVFHVALGGSPIPDDKIAVPKAVFRELLFSALTAVPQSLLKLPYTAGQSVEETHFISLFIRPIVCPAVEGHLTQKSMEIRFFAPGNLVCNLDFIEMIFGNAGDPHLPENDAALDPESWTGHTGCVILAPHLTRLKKKDLGLPSWDKATERQRRDGQCWKEPTELYNNGQAFKITSRDASGTIVTVIADNYFGYCKKEVKTQISFSANLYGLSEEEHSGGALAFCSYDLGEEFKLDPNLAQNNNTIEDVRLLLGNRIEWQSEGYAIDRQYPTIIYVPSEAHFYLSDQTILWKQNGVSQQIRLKVDHTYILPSGYKVHMKKQTGGHAWHLIGTVSEGFLCHKPCTVSGGGKSEISKSIVDAMIQGPVFTADFHKDMKIVSDLLKGNYAKRFKHNPHSDRPSRPVLSPLRSLGSVIKLFTVSPDYTDEFNQWLKSIPDYIKEILLTVKRFYKPEWGEEFEKYFSADIVNGQLSHELKFNNRKLVANYLRVGLEADGAWRTFRVRADYAASQKIQYADDITASVVVPRSWLGKVYAQESRESLKVIQNCENYLFQRPDDAVIRGYDKQTEQDLSQSGNFLSNFEPLNRKAAEEIIDDAILFDSFTLPMKNLLQGFVGNGGSCEYVVSSAHPRIVDGKPSKNPRYLQRRPDRMDPQKSTIAEIGARLHRQVSSQEPLFFPVSAVLTGRRGNPPDAKNGVPPLAVYGPIHYQELPELFIDFICSLTGKSPSTTGFGSEGALTKGPFNALWSVIDLNNALLSFILCGYGGFSSAAGYVGPKYRVDHDISLLMPEIWSHMRLEEQEPSYLIERGFLDRMDDFEYQGKKIVASLLGYRINQRFVNEFLGRIFSNPNIVFNEEMLAPERQDRAVFAESMENIVLTMKRVAQHYFSDGSVEWACPPLKALLHVMAEGKFGTLTIHDPEFRALFTREAILKSDWYQKRLKVRQEHEKTLWKRHETSLENFIAQKTNQKTTQSLKLSVRLERVRAELKRIDSPSYISWLERTIGLDPAAFIST